MPRQKERVNENGQIQRDSEAQLISLKCNAPAEVSYMTEAKTTITGQFAPRSLWKMYDVVNTQDADRLTGGRVKYFLAEIVKSLKADPAWDTSCNMSTDYKIVKYMDKAGGFGPWESVWTSTNRNPKYMDTKSGKKPKWKN